MFLDNTAVVFYRKFIHEIHDVSLKSAFVFAAQQKCCPLRLFRIPRRIGSSSFDAALKRKPQSRREASLRKSAAAAKKVENEAAAAAKKVENEAAAAKKVEEEAAAGKKVEEESNEQSNKQEVVEVEDFNDLALMQPSLGRSFFAKRWGKGLHILNFSWNFR